MRNSHMIIIEQLKKVKDTRSHINQVYPVMEVAFLVITAMICGQNKWTEIKDFGEGNIEWLREYFPYENGLPTRHNIAAIMNRCARDALRSDGGLGQFAQREACSAYNQC